MTLPSKELIDFWRPKLRALDPWRLVQLEEIDELYAEREGAPYRALARDLVIAERPAEVKVLLCGARGSGKTTELTRLAHDVKEHFCVVQTDLGAGLPDQASTLAVVTLLGVAALRAIKIWSEPDDDVQALVPTGRASVTRGVARLQEALQRFGDGGPKVVDLLDEVSGIVTTFFGPTLGVGLAAASGVAKAAGSTATAITKLRNDLARGPLEGRLSPDKRDDAQAVVEAVNGILADLQALAGRPPLLLADGLDKRTRLDEVAQALDDEYLLRDLQAALVLTGPVNLRHDPRFRAIPGNFRLALLYNVPIWHRLDGTVRPAAHGVQVLEDLYQRRREDAGIPEDLIGKPLVERAAQSCAGIVRDFLGILHEAGKHALSRGQRRVDPADVEAAIKARRLEMEGYLNERSLDTLSRVLDKSTLPDTPEADTLLFENFIACYHNGDIWFRPHEIIVDYIQAHSLDE